MTNRTKNQAVCWASPYLSRIPHIYILSKRRFLPQPILK